MAEVCFHPDGFGTPCPEPKAQTDWEALVREYLPEVPEPDRAQMVDVLTRGFPRVAAVSTDAVGQLATDMQRELGDVVRREVCPTCHERGFRQCHCEAVRGQP